MSERSLVDMSDAEFKEWDRGFKRELLPAEIERVLIGYGLAPRAAQAAASEIAGLLDDR